MKPIENQFFTSNFIERLIPTKYTLMPNVADIFEIEFALGELETLSDDDLLNRSAYFSKVNGIETNHYKIGLASSIDAYNKKSIRTRAFFTKGRFSTGYAVHGLFPYRGKFHPQLIKGIINNIGIKNGETILDPMMGSGTACVEAQLIGINCLGFDISPFCVLMATAKSLSLIADPKRLENALGNIEKTTQYIEKHKTDLLTDPFFHDESTIVSLAYLDAMGYARRVIGQSTIDKFPEVLARYKQTITNFTNLRSEMNLTLGISNYQLADAKNLPIENNSIDGIITSPPYSFAIDYIENDFPQLEFLGVDVDKLREQLMGLRGGRKKADRIRAYLDDLELIIKEMARVLKQDKFAVIIIGSNEIQTGGIRFEENVKEYASKYKLLLKKEMLKPIRGIQNSMTDEYVLFFQKSVL